MEIKKPYGYIYKISMPGLDHVYVGKTVKSLAQRFKEHKSDAKNKAKEIKGNAALYEVMRVFGVEKFGIEKLCEVKSEKELVEKEEYFIKLFDSVKNGLNRVNAARITATKEPKILIKINGIYKEFNSKAHLCRELKISNSTLNHWQINHNLSLENAVEKSLVASKKEQEKGFICFRKSYKTYVDLAADKIINRHKLSGREIAARVRKGMSVENAISTPKKKIIKSIEIKINGENHEFKNVSSAYKKLKSEYNLPAYSAVIQRIEKGECPEEAFGFETRPWLKKFDTYQDLINKKGYKLIGELKSWSIPIILNHTKEIFANKQIFAKEHGLEYTETSKKLKKGVSPEEILKSSGHLK